LQTLALLQGLLAKVLEGEKAQELVVRLNETLAAMSGMLNALLDINQIEAGTVTAEKVHFPINELLDRLRLEFSYLAQARGLGLQVVPCSLWIYSDPRLLEQMIRNLLSNALKYTKRGRVLLGCRRHQGMLSIEIWDTGVGIPGNELQSIFEEFHQLDNAAHEQSRGFGLGLSIVQQLGDLLECSVSVRSNPGKGSVFAIQVPLPEREDVLAGSIGSSAPNSISHQAHRPGNILIVEDEPEVRELLELILRDEGHTVMAAPDAVIGLSMVTQGRIQPDLILADYNLPNGMTGLQLAVRVREYLRAQTPVIILTGDISTDTLRSIATEQCVQLNKPVEMTELTQIIHRLLPPPATLLPPRAEPGVRPVIFVVEDNDPLRQTIQDMLESDGHTVRSFGSGEAFLDGYESVSSSNACLLIDAYLTGISGLQVLQRLADTGRQLPSIMITGKGDVQIAVQAMKAGASDFIEKPVGLSRLRASIAEALEQARDDTKRAAWQREAMQRLGGLTPRQRQVMDRVLAGQPNKNIAADLGISQRTVENHRAFIMKKTGATSLPALARLALARGGHPAGNFPPSED
ncbi:MAG: response regulator, partial [Alphaproteobacteria bacterium]|nr:response regulator [Alphaproteobacteria bacterium]